MRFRRGLISSLAALAPASGGEGGDPLGTPASVGTAEQATGVGATMAIVTSATAEVDDLIVVLAHGGSSNAATSCTDSAGNTYTVGNTVSVGTRRMTALWSKATSQLPSGGSITITFASATGLKFATAAKVDGTTASPLDQQGTGATGTATTNPSTTTGTLAQAAEIVFGLLLVVGDAGADGYTEDAAFTALTGKSVAGASGGVLHLAYKITAATTAVTYAPTLSVSRDWAVNYVAFKGN